MILKILFNLYVIVEMVLKQLISSFDTALASLDVQREILFNKITSIDDAILVKNKNRTIYIVISKAKVQISLIKGNIANGRCSFKREI